MKLFEYVSFLFVLNLKKEKTAYWTLLSTKWAIYQASSKILELKIRNVDLILGIFRLIRVFYKKKQTRSVGLELF